MSARKLRRLASIGLAASALLAGPALASSHREAPFIGGMGRVDATDFYMFRSYETGRSDFVTFIANYQPFQNHIGGPNFYPLDDRARYEILVNNDGQAVENLTFRFHFQNTIKGLSLPVNGVNVPVALSNLGAFGQNGDPNDTANLNRIESYTIEVVRGPRHEAEVSQFVTNAATGATVFAKPTDYYGTRSAPDYAAYAAAHVWPINIPGCSTPGRVFVGQRIDPFNINLGQTFDLIDYATITVPANPLETGTVPQNTATAFVPAGEANKNAGQNTNRNNSVTAIELEVPIACLTAAGSSDPVIGAWTAAELPRAAVFTTMPEAAQREVARTNGDFVEVSRDGMALVNELVIGLPDKDKFNSSEPVNDPQFLTYVTNPTFPAALEALFGPHGAVANYGVVAPTLFPRADLVATFLTGIKGLNQPQNVKPGEMIRLNTSIAPTPAAMQNPLGVIGGDNAGYPNGRRPGDDSTDITLRVANGRLISLGLFGTPSQAPAGAADLTQGARQSAAAFDTTFPYLKTPFPGNLAGGGN